MPFYERQPYISPLHQILAEVLRGEIRIPRFQRPGTEWQAVQRGDLLDSLYRGFPIGTILLWSTTSPVRTKDVIGGFKICASTQRDAQRLLLDGHQRLSTLVEILGRGLIEDLRITDVAPTDEAVEHPYGKETWVFELAPNSKEVAQPERSRDRFVLLKPDQEPTPTQIPLSLALNRKALNRWVREHENTLSDAQVAEVDGLRDRLREFNMPVAVLAVDSLDDATESFKRINSSGTPMTDFNMVAALAYRDDFDPQDRFEELRGEQLEPIGWQELSDMDLLRVCAALAGQHPAKIQVDALSETLAKQDDLVQRSFAAAARSAQLLGELCGIIAPRVLPYSWQLITLAVALGSDAPNTPATGVSEAIRRWLWLTTYGEVFQGVNSAIYDRSLAALRDMINHGPERIRTMERDINKRVPPVPGFDFRAARSKAVMLAMARHEDGDNHQGAAHRALAGGSDAIGVLQPKGKRSDWWNRVIITEPSVQHYREAIRNREKDAAEAEDNALLARMGIPVEAKGEIKGLLAARRELIETEERTFVAALGLKWLETG